MLTLCLHARGLKILIQDSISGDISAGDRLLADEVGVEPGMG